MANVTIKEAIDAASVLCGQRDERETVDGVGQGVEEQCEEVERGVENTQSQC